MPRDVMLRLCCVVLWAVTSIACHGGHRTHAPSESPQARAHAQRLVTDIVNELMGSAHVVALGENSHGTREFRRALHDATMVGIEKHALGVVLLELGNAYVERLDAYVGSCGPSSLGPPERLDRATLGILHTPEFLGFLEAVRRHNVAAPERCVRLVGIEAAVGEGPSRGLRALVEPYLTESARRRLQNALARQRGWSLERRVPDAEQRERVRQDLAAVRVLLEDATSWSEGTPPPPVVAEMPYWIGLCEQRLAMAIDPLERERFMAENVTFWSRVTPPDRAVLLYAHTFHVAAGPYEFKGREQRPMGTFLRATLGDDYRVVGMTFGEGTFLAMQPIGGPRLRGIHVARIHAPSQPCLEQELLARGEATLLLRPALECAALGDACKAMRMIGIVYPIGFHDMKLDYHGIDVVRAFDAVVFFAWGNADR